MEQRQDPADNVRLQYDPVAARQRLEEQARKARQAEAVARALRISRERPE